MLMISYVILKYAPYDWLKYRGMAILVCRKKIASGKGAGSRGGAKSWSIRLRHPAAPSDRLDGSPKLVHSPPAAYSLTMNMSCTDPGNYITPLYKPSILNNVAPFVQKNVAK